MEGNRVAKWLWKTLSAVMARHIGGSVRPEGEDSMTRRLFMTGVLAVVIAIGPSLGQAFAQEKAKGSKTPASADAGRTYVPPRTPWGDPDLQGTFTNKYEHQTPLERPAGFEGRRVEDISGTELAAILTKRNQQVLDRAAGVGPLEFRDSLEVTKASRAWLIVDPPDGKIPPLAPIDGRRNPSGEAPLDVVNARARSGSSFGNGPFDSPEDFSLFDRCITRGLPGSMIPFIHGNSYQIVQAPGHVSITYEIMHEARIIPTTARPALGGAIRQYLGESRGRWEGHTLVVETTNFNQRSTYRNANAATLRLVERFTRTAPDRIEWAVTIDDPMTWTKSWTFAMPLTMNEREPVLEFACHEGNYALRHILSAARAAERASEAAKKP